MPWRRKWQPTPVFLPGESQGRGSLVGCRLMGSHRVRHNWSDLAAALELYIHSLVAQTVKNLPAMRETWVRSLGWEDPLEKGMATHSSILAWRIPWTEEPDRLQSMESQRVRCDLATEQRTTDILSYRLFIFYSVGQIIWVPIMCQA